MTLLMENRSYCMVIDYIISKYNFKKKINMETSLSDLGLDGDDVLDFLIEFFKTFNIDYEQTNYKDFIPKESNFLANTIISIINNKKRQSENEIFVKDLVMSLDKKKWHKKLER